LRNKLEPGRGGDALEASPRIPRNCPERKGDRETSFWLQGEKGGGRKKRTAIGDAAKKQGAKEEKKAKVQKIGLDGYVSVQGGAKKREI